ncbi:transient receptor potential cation channel subfamily m member 2 [Plakobranchus ocellatus]|uniref:Transient receptor potential cation channel subfamily m member 2 n=1 Tax=Plakobranchus ocellatus TaxID=259542 RepID=A0AAV3YL67_9GAST|nr:transient receptor potential cation channel subfamily m member 2 [Plakobranchus ocellatus]
MERLVSDMVGKWDLTSPKLVLTVISSNKHFKEWSYHEDIDNFQDGLIKALNQLIEECNEYNLPLCLGFIHYEKAFESVEHAALAQALRKINIKENYVIIIENTYKGDTARIHMDNQISESFAIQKRVRKGDPISPKLFIKVIKQVLKQAASFADMMILMDGQNYGTAQIIGEAVAKERNRRKILTREQALVRFVSSEQLPKIVVMGLVPQQALSQAVSDSIGNSVNIGTLGKTNILISQRDESIDGESSRINRNLTHFLITNKEMGPACQTNFLKQLELRLTKPIERRLSSLTMDDEVGPIPLIGLLVQGGPQEIDRVLALVKKNVPVIVLCGLGMAGDIIAYAVREFQQSFDSYTYEMYVKIELRRLLTAFFPDEFQGNNLARNQCRDRVLQCVSYAIKVTKDMFQEALLRPDREEFVDLFLNRGFVLHTFLTQSRLEMLFEQCQDKDFFAGICMETILGEKVAIYALLFWATLTHNIKLVRILWRKTSDPMSTGIVISTLYNRMAKDFIDDHDLRLTVKNEGIEFSELAVKLLDLTYEESKPQAMQCLIQPLPDFNNLRATDLAHLGKNKIFIAHRCCQRLIYSLWYGSVRFTNISYGMFQMPEFAKICLNKPTNFKFLSGRPGDTKNRSSYKYGNFLIFRFVKLLDIDISLLVCSAQYRVLKSSRRKPIKCEERGTSSKGIDNIVYLVHLCRRNKMNRRGKMLAN